MKIMTVLGTRPEIIRLSLIIKELDKCTHHVLVHTRQNYDGLLSDIFFEQMEIRKPNIVLSTSAESFGVQLASMIAVIEKVIMDEMPDRVLILGDTNTALATAIVASRLKIPLYHMEAGNRCFDTSVPEELNRKMIDAVSDVNLPYTSGSRDNLLAEGVKSNRIGVTGNPIYEVLQHYEQLVVQSNVLERLEVRSRAYILVTAHRAENVDNPERLRNIFQALGVIAEKESLPIICSIHPHTQKKMEEYGVTALHPLIQLHEPFGFFDFVQLERKAAVVLTDSGTVQEECCIFQVPAVTMRVTTERPETVVCGSNTLAGVEVDGIVRCTELALQKPVGWSIPAGYDDRHVSWKVMNLILGGQIYVQG